MCNHSKTTSKQSFFLSQGVSNWALFAICLASVDKKSYVIKRKGGLDLFSIIQSESCLYKINMDWSCALFVLPSRHMRTRHMRSCYMPTSHTRSRHMHIPHMLTRHMGNSMLNWTLVVINEYKVYRSKPLISL